MSDPGPPPPVPDRALTRSGLLARNVALNAAGSVLPALAAFVAVPILIAGYGSARFGTLTLGWTALGYFSLFDFGIARAVTHAVADRLGASRKHEVATTVWTSTLLVLPIGVAVAIAVYLGAGWGARMLSLPPALETESAAAFRVLALAIPFVTVSGALRGALEGQQSFGFVNALRIPLGLLTFVSPLVCLPFSRSLVPAMWVLALGRAALCVAHVVAVRRAIPDVATEPVRWSGTIGRQLLTVGGWMQVSHLVSPLMATLDRFVVGAVLGVAAVTYYAVPLEVVTKMWLFPIAVLPVFFSAVTMTGTRDAERTTVLFDSYLRVTLALLFLPTLVLVGLAPEILRLWLGQDFAQQSAGIMQLTAIAVLINCLGQGGISLIQALGRPSLTAKFHLAELPVYALMLWWLLPRYGILGAAIAWSARTIVDTVLLLGSCPILMPAARAVVARSGVWLLMAVAMLAAIAFVADAALRIAIIAIVAPAWIAATWRLLLTPNERSMAERLLTWAWRPERA